MLTKVTRLKVDGPTWVALPFRLKVLSTSIMNLFGMTFVLVDLKGAGSLLSAQTSSALKRTKNTEDFIVPGMIKECVSAKNMKREK
jgi:hypothetical protein